MYVNGQNLTLSELSRGKIKQNYMNEKFIINWDMQIPQLDFIQNQSLNQPENVLYIDNYDQYGKIYNGGYIFSTLPYEYDLVYENGEYYVDHIESSTKIKNTGDLSEPQISEPSFTNKLKKSIVKKEKPFPPKKASKSTISKPMR
jgi:hypothetical protein